MKKGNTVGWIVAAGIAAAIFYVRSKRNSAPVELPQVEQPIVEPEQPQDQQEPEDKISPTQEVSDGKVIKIIAGNNGKGTFAIRIFFENATRTGRMNEQQLADFIAKNPTVTVEYVEGNPNNNVRV